VSGNFPAINETSLVRIVQSIRDLFQGRSNAMGTFTLGTGVTSTTVTATNCGDQSIITLTPMTAHAASALTTTYIQAADITRGQFIVTHASTANNDLTFGYSIQG
jgi:hypothetical protein